MAAIFEIDSDSLDSTIAIGEAFASLLKDGDTIVLCGDLGAGKTHFSKGVAKGMAIDTVITSPTFNILRLYEAPDGRTLAHWDLYRLDEESQLEDVDFFAITESGAISLIEWGDKFEDSLPKEHVRLNISLAQGDLRKLEFRGYGPRGNSLVLEIRDLLEVDAADGC